ncbi:MAG TPA: Gx transporter family protein [Sphaerochaeta sp.]|nr:Gx transporter family protein [Sphaerochaeta sp.]
MMSRTERKVAFISATTLLFSTLEFLIPKPLPFLRLGLANLPLLIILPIVDFKTYLAVLLLKVIGQGMVSGTLFSYLILISLAGTFTSGVAMYATKRVLKDRVSLLGCSLIGAFVSNLSQLAVAALIVYGKSIWIAAPLMLGLGLVSSFGLGVLAEYFWRKSSAVAHLADDSLDLGIPYLAEREHAKLASLTALLSIIAIIASRNLLPLIGITLLMFGMQAACRRKIRIGPPLMLISSLIIVSFLEPNGKVLMTFGKFVLTETALEVALIKALRLISLIAASQCLVRSNPPLRGSIGRALLLTLAYFNLLTTSYTERSGKLLERVDQALIESAAGTRVLSVAQPKSINTAMVLLSGIAVIALSLISRFALI